MKKFTCAWYSKEISLDDRMRNYISRCCPFYSDILSVMNENLISDSDPDGIEKEFDSLEAAKNSRNWSTEVYPFTAHGLHRVRLGATVIESWEYESDDEDAGWTDSEFEDIAEFTADDIEKLLEAMNLDIADFYNDLDEEAYR